MKFEMKSGDEAVAVEGSELLILKAFGFGTLNIVAAEGKTALVRKKR